MPTPWDGPSAGNGLVSGEHSLAVFLDLDLGLPDEHLLGARDLGLAHLRVVDRQADASDGLALRHTTPLYDGQTYPFA
jgi:hypothetical protein